MKINMKYLYYFIIKNGRIQFCIHKKKLISKDTKLDEMRFESSVEDFDHPLDFLFHKPVLKEAFRTKVKPPEVVSNENSKLYTNGKL